ncbi:hypothetical protein D3C77_533890 [compost metagenome]
MDVLQAGGTGHAIGTAGDIAVPADDQRQRRLGVVIKKCEQPFDHALGMGGVLGVLPEKQGHAQGGGITAAEDVAGSSGVFRLFGRGDGEGRDRPVGHGVAGRVFECGTNSSGLDDVSCRHRGFVVFGVS